jgi:single-strand DNA-binding protein
MGRSVNKVILLGRAGKDPSVHILRTGTVINLSLATSERYRDIHGDWQEHTEWHNLVGFQRTAEILRDYVRKGSLLYIEGSLRTRSWDDRQTGQRRHRSEIVVAEVSLLSPPPDGGSDDVEHYVSGQGFAPSEFSEEPEITQEEVPYRSGTALKRSKPKILNSGPLLVPITRCEPRPNWMSALAC